MSETKTPTAIEKREKNRKALEPFALDNLKEKLPLVLSPDPDLPPSPKPRYRSAYRYLGADDLTTETIEVFSPSYNMFVRVWYPRDNDRALRAGHVGSSDSPCCTAR